MGLTKLVAVLSGGGDAAPSDLNMLAAGPAVELVFSDLPPAQLVSHGTLVPHILVKIRRRVILPLCNYQGKNSVNLLWATPLLAHPKGEGVKGEVGLGGDKKVKGGAGTMRNMEACAQKPEEGKDRRVHAPYVQWLTKDTTPSPIDFSLLISILSCIGGGKSNLTSSLFRQVKMGPEKVNGLPKGTQQISSRAGNRAQVSSHFPGLRREYHFQVPAPGQLLPSQVEVGRWRMEKHMRERERENR